MKKRDIFEIWHSSKEDRNSTICNFIMQKFNMVDVESAPRVLKMYVSSLISKISSKWQLSHNTLTRFLAEQEEWLESEVTLPYEFLHVLPSSSRQESSDNTKIGRPEKSFEKCTLKVKKRKIKDLVATKTREELALATEVSLRSSGKRDAANIVKELATASPSRATMIKKAKRIFDTPDKNLSAESALALMVNTKLSTHQYNTVRLHVKNIHPNLYPPYHQVKKAKEECYPPMDAINVTEVSAEIELQALLDLTVKRICLVKKEDFNDFSEVASKSLRLISKWGCDGSSAQSRYKQKLTDDCSDEHLFSVTLVPLRLLDDQNNQVIWQNPRPNSTRFCRLVRFAFQKENRDVIKHEVCQMQQQIANLVPSRLEINSTEVECRHELLLTMVDGKVCSALSQYDSTQRCFICGAGPKQMNNISTAPSTTNPLMYAFGISPLHSWIRAFECLLHISYKLEIQKWQARSTADKNSVSTRKAMIQNRFRIEMGLLVDMPKQSAGNTNDGNTARRFFRNTEQTAAITGLDIDLIYRFRVILEALSCDHELDSKKFAEYARDTRNKYVLLYPWYYLPASIHKILIHAEEIIKASILPLGQLAEEAQEASNKEYRRFREHFSRKTSRQDTNRDVLNRFLISSDPVLSSLNKAAPRKHYQFPQETVMLLKATEGTDTEEEEEKEEEEIVDSDDSVK